MDAGGTPFLTGDRSEELLAHAEQLVAEGRGRELLLVPGWWHAISAESLVDRAYRTPDTVEAAARVECPVLFIRGDAEPAAVYPAELFRDRCAGPCDVVIVDDCDHFYTGREAAVADVVADWLERALDPDGSAGAQDPAGAAER
jgi:pimeloyl-ACP methyl ester carboxylesterase